MVGRASAGRSPVVAERDRVISKPWASGPSLSAKCRLPRRLWLELDSAKDGSALLASGSTRSGGSNELDEGCEDGTTVGAASALEAASTGRAGRRLDDEAAAAAAAVPLTVRARGGERAAGEETVAEVGLEVSRDRIWFWV